MSEKKKPTDSDNFGIEGKKNGNELQKLAETINVNTALGLLPASKKYLHYLTKFRL